MSDESVFAKINREADATRRARWAELEADGNVWDELDVWLDCGRADDLRPIENAIFAYWAGVAKRRNKSLKDVYEPDVLMETVASVWREIIADMDKDNPPRIVAPAPNNHQLPLRDVMGKRGEGIEWMNLGPDMMGRKHVRAVVVKIGAGRKK